MGNTYWLLKTEPETYSFEMLLQDQKTNWNGVRNFQARNFLKEMKTGDLAFIYHSGDTRAIIGIARVIKGAYPDPDASKPGDWVQVDLEPVRALKNPIPLSTLKSAPDLNSLLLIKQSRLSVMPVSATHYRNILQFENSPSEKSRKR